MAVDKRAARLGVLALVATMLFGLVGARLWFLQTVEQEGLQEEVDQTKRRTVPLLPERGRIFDADGRILADNERVLTVGIDWEVLRSESNRTELFSRVSGWVGVPVEEMERRFQSQVYSPFLPMPVAEDIDERTAATLLERVEDLPGVQIIEEARRVYPYAPLASHVVGYMGSITAETKDAYVGDGYFLNERVGQFGIEASMERELHGQWGYVVYEVDKSSRIVREIERVPAINGNDIQLTIDLDQQQYAEQALESQLKLRRLATARNGLDPETNFVERFFPEYPEEVPFKAPAGAVVVQNWENGHIVALASYPTFDNRWFESDLGGGKFEQLFPAVDEFGDPIDPDESILVNRAIQGRYNLGSTFKPFTAYAALSTGLMGVNDYYTDEGTYRMTSIDQDRCNSGLVRCVFKNATCSGTGRPCVYGSVDVETALAVSSDAFFYRIGENIMVENDFGPVLQEQVRLFGFGEDTGIALPFEFDGTVPDKELKARYAELGVISEAEGQDYYTGDNVQLSIGQGLLSASPLHLATGYSTLANGGFVLKPEIVKAIYQPGVPDSVEPGFADIAQAQFAVEPNVRGDLVRQIPFPQEFKDEITTGLQRVIYGPGTTSDYYHSTTGEKLFYYYPRGSEAIPLAGKTGTAQGRNNYPWNDSSAFAAYSTDAERPYTVSAYLEKAGYGSQAAGPVVKCIFMQLSGLAPADPVVLSDPLDTNSIFAAPENDLTDQSCYAGRYSAVSTTE
ncbi:penicillin-binding transpeptidase domain-containing protein [Ilumatobacter coccineus]|uniref:Penicillin-binding protein 2 n=1 Tax=Ilumatobacter coccineus (strain NBRC 103263 / KCTC 29153 / YM16-304) TaxID=1313172 RepID=A0A6C7E6Y1_ILUCY|nr:penicillin-binding transpeptidase domain-containing protein [Ilumatobacter coccineus]BAN02153.1 penicillin-binding protein 2 [Ilumatobacter coccineus YM16-304]